MVNLLIVNYFTIIILKPYVFVKKVRFSFLKIPTNSYVTAAKAAVVLIRWTAISIDNSTSHRIAAQLAGIAGIALNGVDLRAV
ncbi:hypothetical protein Osc2_21430 [Ruminococcus sp. 25CYCFAH16]